MTGYGCINELQRRIGLLKLFPLNFLLILPQGNGHAGQADEAAFVQGDLKIDYVSRTVELDNQTLKLTRKEYELLRLLTRNAGKVLTHDFLLREIWGPAQADQAQYLRVHIGNLRQKLRDDPARPVFILTEPGVGYRFIT